MQTPAPFEYERATSVEGAVASLQRLGSDARIIAGGHSLLPMMKLRLAKPKHLIDINDLSELSYIRKEGAEVRIGALTRHVQLQRSDVLTRHFPLFRDAEDMIADPAWPGPPRSGRPSARRRPFRPSVQRPHPGRRRWPR